ncbi:CheR-type MCP methyltransferase [Pandoraea captiosa]|uniref:CheR-type MCP methyltransferase n=1 Tax=Pandoraea captiosa TaxID=2508302 RepID=A0A5E4ZTY5_9BURK|nr:CheR family methyltransferase [Pandoraea captiosa]VVE63410.1 CheR-type MCP methyltransferase [Pandoraea captiosa]
MTHVPDIERLLRDTTGIDADTLGIHAIERAVRARLAALSPEMQDAPPYARYWQRLQQSSHELQALIEAVVVPETWFFRHREAFTTLGRMAQEARAARRGTASERQPLRLLSLPCSTGEEPYSMAMAMFDAGFGANDFTIDAVDISERALAVAREGLYGRNSFRGAPDTLLFRDRYFTSEEDNHRVIGALRTQVRWHAGNLFDPSLVDRLGTFDFVFFRNVLIYFDRDGQRRAIAALERLMRVGATLFAGPAEGGTLTSNCLAPTGHAQAFSFRVAVPARDVTQAAPSTDAKPSARGIPARTFAPPTRPAPPTLPTRPTTDSPRLARAGESPLAPSVVSAVVPAVVPAVVSSIGAMAKAEIDVQLTQARAAADAGDFVRAVALCRAVLAADRANAQAEYLLGLVEDARSDAQGALIHYRRALYLDPTHYEALVHCAALLDARGDVSGARRLMARAERVEPSGETMASSETHDPMQRHGTRHR